MAYVYIKGKFAASGDRSDIPLTQDLENLNYASYANGFPEITSQAKEEGGLPPHRDDLNEALYLSIGNLYELQTGNYPTFLTAHTAGYPTGAVLWSAAEKRFLMSTKDSNTDNFIITPSYIGTSWIFVDADIFSNVNIGLAITAGASSLTIAEGIAKSNLGRILKISSPLIKTWDDIQTDSDITAEASTQYYVFLIYNPTTPTYKAIINASAGAPDNLPSGYTDYVLLGYMVTAADTSPSIGYPTIDSGTFYKKGGYLPDYSSGISKTRGTEYTADIDGIVVFCIKDEHGGEMRFFIDGIQVFFSGGRDNDARSVDGNFRISKGQTYQITGGSETWTYAFYPLKGALL